jgi:hypothetical protein
MSGLMEVTSFKLILEQEKDIFNHQKQRKM